MKYLITEEQLSRLQKRAPMVEELYALKPIEPLSKEAIEHLWEVSRAAIPRKSTFAKLIEAHILGEKT